MKNLHSIVILLVTSLNVVTAAEYCDGTLRTASQPNLCLYIHNVAVYGDVNRRKTEAGFAAYVADLRDHHGLSDYIQKVAVYGDHDHRLNEANFAASVGESKQTIRARYAATGTIRCRNYEGTAEVVAKNDTIVTAAHMFYFGLTCNPRGTADMCVFSYSKSDGTARTIKVKKCLTKDLGVPELRNPIGPIYRIQNKIGLF